MKTQTELDLANKLDLARTLARLEARVETRTRLNDLEHAIKLEHEARIQDGRPTGISVADITAAITTALRPTLPDKTDG